MLKFSGKPVTLSGTQVSRVLAMASGDSLDAKALPSVDR